jgi:ribonuclease R
MAGQSQRHDTEKRLLELLSKRGIEGVRKADLRRQLGLHGQAHARHFSDILRRLVASGTVLRRQRGRYALPQEANMIAGRLSVHHRGFGFVTTEDGQPDVFIPPSGIGLALSGDLVEIVLEEDTGRGPAGRVARILERGTEEVTGEFVTQDDVFFVRPLRRDFPEFIPLNSDIGETDHLQATHGDWVTARLLHPERQGQHLHATLLRRLNTGATLTDDLDAIVSEFDLPPPYSSADCKLAETLAPVDITRVDRTDLTIITVDPVDAKDFDDAVSLEPGTEPGTVILGVHIADVAAYVQPNSPLDAAARERSFTAYLPGRTLPMLPRPLAAEICSLREGVERPAHSVFMEINSESGAPIRSWRLRTLVRVTKRLSFDGVQAFADGRHLDALPPAVEAMLGQLLPLAARMRQRRAAEEQFLDLATTEVRVICEENPPLIRGLKRSEPNEAHELVEEFMLAANVAVAQELREHRIPGIFRVHPKPQEPDIKEFRTWVKAALNLQPGHLSGRKAVNRFIRAIPDTAVHDIVNTAFLRALPRAGYSHKIESHYGLGKECYCHFTSPIRRYPDLLVHQQLLEADREGSLRSMEDCAAIAKACTEIEANNDEAAFAALDRIKLRYVQQMQQAGEKLSYEGIVARLLPEALLIHIPELGIFGTLPKELLGKETFYFSAQRHELRGKRTGKTYRCGQTMYVQVEKADVVKGALFLRPVRLRPKA